MLHTKIVDTKKEKIITSNAEKFIKDSKFGASIYFLGTVRNINDNKKVTGITYDSHDGMVIKSFEKIYNDAEKKLDIKDKVIFGMGGYGGNAILIDMENSRIVVLNSLHYNNTKFKYNHKKLLIDPIKNGKQVN